MSRKKQRKIEKPTTQEQVDNRFVADFSFETVWVSTKHGDFTNLLKDDAQFYQYHGLLFGKILPVLKKQKFKSGGDYIFKLKNNYIMPHSHSIEEAEKLSLIYEILKKALIKSKNYSVEDASEYIEQNISSEKLYQIGLESIRIIGYFDMNIFVVLLMDYHHLIYPSKYDNQPDYKHYSVCPFERGTKD